MARKPIKIHDKEFNSQKEALEYFKNLLNSYNDGHIFQRHDHEMLAGLLERHAEAHDKIGPGIKHFHKNPARKGTSCFYVERVDGSSTDFSYIWAVNARSKSLYQEFIDACRDAVRSLHRQFSLLEATRCIS